MESDQFISWFRSILVPYCDTIPGNKILFMDGHSSHFSLEVCRLAKEKNISLIVFPPHTSHALQPLDVAVFGPVKKAWRQLVEEHARSNNFQNVEKADFAPLFAKITDRNLGFLRGHVFERTGIYPLNPAMLSKK